MSLQVDWSEPARRDLEALPDWRLAATVDAAVDQLVHDGLGFVQHIHRSDGPDEFRLLIPRVRTYVRVRRTATVLYVERVIYRP